MSHEPQAPRQTGKTSKNDAAAAAKARPRLVDFKNLHAMIQAHPNGWAALSGIERGPAGIDPKTDPVCVKAAASVFWDLRDSGEAFSFCINGYTCTAFENPEDGYRSALGFFVIRKGNHCSTQFQPVALLSDLTMQAARHNPNQAVMLNLRHPTTRELALSVGTENYDDYYPCFIAHHDPQVLEAARGLDLILADDLRKILPAGAKPVKMRI